MKIVFSIFSKMQHVIREIPRSSILDISGYKNIIMESNWTVEPQGSENSIRNRRNIGDGTSQATSDNSVYHTEYLETLSKNNFLTIVHEKFDGLKSTDIPKEILALDAKKTMQNSDSLKFEEEEFKPVIRNKNKNPSKLPLHPDLPVSEFELCRWKQSFEKRRKVLKKPRLKTTVTIRSKLQPSTLSTIEIDKKFKNFRKVKDNGLCSQNCHCYECTLLNWTSDDATEDECDSVAIAYGLEPCTYEPKYRKGPSKTRAKIQDNSELSSHRDQLKQPFGQGAMIREMPSFVRDFEKILNQTREESMTDFVFDSIINAFIRSWSIIQALWSIITSHNRRRVVPQRSTFTNYQRGEEKLENLNTAEVHV